MDVGNVGVPKFQTNPYNSICIYIYIIEPTLFHLRATTLSEWPCHVPFRLRKTAGGPVQWHHLLRTIYPQCHLSCWGKKDETWDFRVTEFQAGQLTPAISRLHVYVPPAFRVQEMFGTSKGRWSMVTLVTSHLGIHLPTSLVMIEARKVHDQHWRLWKYIPTAQHVGKQSNLMHRHSLWHLMRRDFWVHFSDRPLLWDSPDFLR